jgi:glyoxylase-like metal-dependent hydrolase (beta-lactamase superfamily II)
MKTAQFAAITCAAMMLAWGHTSLAQTPPSAPERSITQISGDLYRFQDNVHYGVFLVTPAGVVVADPLNRAAAEWLKGEIAARFQGAKVTTVVYSHFHGDHAGGAAAFADARVLGRPETVADLRPPGPDAGLDSLTAGDANHDKRLQRSEATGVMAQFFANYDKDGDGALTPKEIFDVQTHDVRAPTETWNTKVHTLTLGGSAVEMHYVGGAHADDLSYIYFPAQKTLFVVDVISPGRLPSVGADYIEAERFAQIDKALAFDADIIVGGHGRVGTKADVEAQRQYLTDLRQAVQAAIDAGQTVEQAKASVKLDKYADWIFYREWGASNVEGMYALLKR